MVDSRHGDGRRRRALGSELERFYEVFVRGRLKFRVGSIVYVAFDLEETVMGFAFPKHERDALVGGDPQTSDSGRVNRSAPPRRHTGMDTLKDELERAVPHLEPSRAGVEELVSAGRRAVRRRRARIGGVIAGGGLVVAAVAVGASGSLAPGRTPRAEDPAVATAPSVPQATREDRAKVPLTLESLLEVTGRCPGPGRERPDRVDALVVEDGWAAVEFACADGTVRVLQTPDGERVGRYRVDQPRTLEEWAEARVG